MVTRKMKHKDNAGVVHEYDIGADAKNISEDPTHRFVSDAEKASWNRKADNVVATQTNAGLMSAEDKKKLDGVADGAGDYVHPSTAGWKHIPVGGTVGQVLKNKASGEAEWGKLTAADVGAIQTTAKGTANGVASLDASGKVPAAQLPFGETASTIFSGDKGKTAYDHSQVAHAPANAEANVQSDWNESSTSSDAYIKNKPTNLLTNTGDASNTTAKFVQAASRANILTNEKMAGLFGKIAKWFADLKNHSFSDLIQNATTADSTRAVSAAVAKNLQDQITAQNTNTIRLWAGTLYPSSTVGTYNYANFSTRADKCAAFILYLTIAEDKIYEIIVPHFTGSITKNVYLGENYNVKVSINLNTTTHKIGVKIDKIKGWTYNMVHIDCLYGIFGTPVIA